ncbi:hypothetical protein TNCV_3025451 [Trichonephila clavipes]|nr:hypothetical protein TNCV_3025451 [Trichonephila clavipes]
MNAVSVLEHFSDHDSIHQKLKKNTASVRSYPNSAGDAAVEAIYPHSSVSARMMRGVLVLSVDSFDQQLASPKHPTHFQWGLDLENALAIRDVDPPHCLEQS